MSDKKKLKVVLCWHMHQPQYCDLITGEYQLPWTYLHAIKDYTDMAAHLESVPGARAVVNFAPILLEQISDYAGQVQGFLREGKGIRDPLLAALASPVLPAGSEQRMILIKACRRANESRVINRFEPYKNLVEMAGWFEGHPHGMMYLDDRFLVDLVVWYHLVWLGETVRRSNLLVKKLQEKVGGYTIQDRRDLMALIGELLSGVLRRYAALAKDGQVELSVSPYAHPIMPLLLDLRSAAEAMPQVRLPDIESYPGGEERVHWHLREATNTFEQYFGFKPHGCWPSEGSIGRSLLPLLQEHGFRWAASGETVLHNSLGQSDVDEDLGREEILYQAYKVDGSDVLCFFRDDSLSDLIGFTYSDWHADDAVANFVHHLETIAQGMDDRSNNVVSIILDGENAWEYYPDNGYHFLSALFQTLADHPDLELTTFSDCVSHVQPQPLPHLVAGSWVYGNFSTWIGDRDKNRGWEMLAEAKQAFDKACDDHLEDERLLAARHQLSICEGSDWFWWFGDYNPAESVSDFDRLFRIHLANLYQLLGRSPPEYLSHSFTQGSGTPARGGVMRYGQEHQ